MLPPSPQPKQPIRRLLIANRGEIAVRLVRACREHGLESVVVYSEADSESMAVRMATYAVPVGASPPAESYLRIDKMIAAALSSGCDAVHPGFGFLAENAAFAEACQAAGLIFVGPPAEAIRVMGLKTTALARVRAAGVPTLPGFSDAAGSAIEADYLAAAERIGYPVLVKASAGGGGKGMRIVEAAAELPAALQSARREAEKAFADGRVFLEKYIAEAHHIEFQIFADAHGNTVHLFERECSVQRRHQKIIEESPSPYLMPALRAKMGAAAVAAAQAVNYVNAGTIEFIVDSSTGLFYFLEMNTRLQVEHPVTECVTGLDLVGLQLHVAAGGVLPFTQAELSQRGHAIECRIYAEDPAEQFLPQTGKLLHLTEPQGPGIRVDSGVRSGDTISIYYDPMIAKLIVHAETRAAAIRRMDAALAQYVILGLVNNVSFLRAVIAHPVFGSGQTTTALLGRHFGNWQPAPSDDLSQDLLLIAAAFAHLKTAVTASNGASQPPTDVWDAQDNFRLGKR
jgi:3-methylcrotonyl-CoA carboxylase alpha subunit